MTASIEYIENQIINQVRTTNESDELISILKQIPIESLQNFIISEIRKLDCNSKTYLFHNCLSINDILPIDIIQHILSFDTIKHPELVSKTWNELANNNKKIKLKQRNEAIKQIKFTPNIKYDESLNKTWIVDANRLITTLNDEEIQKGYDGVFTDINKAINICKSGDKILCYNGEYELNYIQSKNIQFIGVGDNVKIVDCGIFDPPRHYPQYYCRIDSDVYFENFILDLTNMAYTFYGIVVCGTLWMKNCVMNVMKGETAISVAGNLHALNCEFADGSSFIHIADHAGNISIIGCKFTDCGQETLITTSYGAGCISIDCWNGLCNNTHIGELKCIGNIFKNNLCYPICERHKKNSGEKRKYTLINADRYLLSNNILMGYNAVKIKNQLDFIDANTVYFNDEGYLKE